MTAHGPYPIAKRRIVPHATQSNHRDPFAANLVQQSGATRPRIIKDFRFEAAQTLPNLPGDHKCTKMHGHSFKLEIAIEGEVDP